MSSRCSKAVSGSTRAWANERGDLTASYRWTSWSSRLQENNLTYRFQKKNVEYTSNYCRRTGRSQPVTGWSSRLWESNLSISRNLWNKPPIIVEKPENRTTCNRLDLETLGFWPTMPKTLKPDTAHGFAELCGFNYLREKEGVNVVASEHDGTT